MSMNPMTPKAVLPPAPAFRLLADLNQYLAYSTQEREAVLADYMGAEAERQLSLIAIAQANQASADDRVDAADTKREAEDAALGTREEAEERAKKVIDAATSQAESVTQKARENVADANKKVKEAEEEAKTLTSGLADAEAAAFAREEVAKELESVAQVAALDAAAVKAEYESLIRDINALQRRAPKK